MSRSLEGSNQVSNAHDLVRTEGTGTSACQRYRLVSGAEAHCGHKRRKTLQVVNPPVVQIPQR
jgi:hypothetical protein